MPPTCAPAPSRVRNMFTGGHAGAVAADAEIRPPLRRAWPNDRGRDRGLCHRRARPRLPGSGTCLREDMLGLSPRTPKFVRRYGELGPMIEAAIEGYATDVRARAFPGPEHVYGMKAKG